MFCSEKKPASFVIITVTIRISLCPPCHTEDCAVGVISGIKRGELPRRQTAQGLKTKGFLGLTLTHSQRMDKSQSFVSKDSAEQSQLRY